MDYIIADFVKFCNDFTEEVLLNCKHVEYSK